MDPLLGEGGNAMQAAPPHSSFARAARSRERTATVPDRGRKTSWSSSDSETESRRGLRPQRKASRFKANGAQKTSTKEGTTADSGTSQLGTTSTADDSGESSEEETLANMQARASHSSVALSSFAKSPSASSARLPSSQSALSLQGRDSPQPGRSAAEAALELPLSLPDRPRKGSPRTVSFDQHAMASPPGGSGPSTARASSRPRVPGRSPGPSGSNLTAVPYLARDLSNSDIRTTASPASSRSALTGDSSVVMPATPRDSGGGRPRESVAMRHSRGGSKDMGSMSSTGVPGSISSTGVPVSGGRAPRWISKY